MFTQSDLHVHVHVVHVDTITVVGHWWVCCVSVVAMRHRAQVQAAVPAQAAPVLASDSWQPEPIPSFVALNADAKPACSWPMPLPPTKPSALGPRTGFSISDAALERFLSPARASSARSGGSGAALTEELASIARARLSTSDVEHLHDLLTAILEERTGSVATAATAARASRQALAELRGGRPLCTRDLCQSLSLWPAPVQEHFMHSILQLGGLPCDAGGTESRGKGGTEPSASTTSAAKNGAVLDGGCSTSDASLEGPFAAATSMLQPIGSTLPPALRSRSSPWVPPRPPTERRASPRPTPDLYRPPTSAINSRHVPLAVLPATAPIHAFSTRASHGERAGLEKIGSRASRHATPRSSHVCAHTSQAL